MMEFVIFCVGVIVGILIVITWALCAANKRREDDHDTSDR